jgi:D-xylose 1-dehydrogenase (NADP+, D-xylono-1,5-lactone-forming)
MGATLRLGLLSTANINRKLLGGVRDADSVEVVAVASRDRERAEAYAAEHGLARAHGSYEALLADAEVDAVYIPLPNSLHVPWSIRALQAGKHVLCEKPLTRRPEEAQAAFDAADRAGRVLAEAFMWRHHPQAHRLRELVRDRTVGQVRLLRATFCFELVGAGRPEDVRLQRELDGGGLMDVGCYCVSALRLLCGEPDRIRAEQVERAGVDGRFAGVLRFPGDVLGMFDCGFDVPPRGVIEVVGEGGTLVAEDPWHGLAPRLTRDGEEIPVQAANPYRLELEDLSAAIRTGGDPRLGRADAVGQARAIEALYAAAAS